MANPEDIAAGEWVTSMEGQPVIQRSDDQSYRSTELPRVVIRKSARRFTPMARKRSMQSPEGHMKCESRRDKSQQDEARRGPGQRIPIKEVVTTDTFRLRSRLTAMGVECQRSNGLLLARSTGAWLLALRHHLLHVPLRIELLVRGVRVLCWCARRSLCGCSLLR